MEEKTTLDRYLSPMDVWAMAFGCAVGWGAFVMPGTTFLPVAGPIGTVIAMLIGMAVMLVIGACFNYLMRRSTRTGGVYSYTKEAFGRDHAFLCSWFLCLSYLTIVFLNGSALFIVIRTLLGNNLTTTVCYTIGNAQISVAEVALSVIALVVVALLFIVAKPMLQRLHSALSIILAVGIIVISFACLPSLSLEQISSLSGTRQYGSFYGILSLVILMPWAFVGFEVVSFDTAHFDFAPQRTGRIIVEAIVFTTISYTAMTLVSVSALPPEYSTWQEYITTIPDLKGVESVATFYAAKTALGTPGLAIIVITALAAILTGIIGGYRAMLRVLSTMAEDRILSERFKKTTYSILFIMVLSILISLLGRNTLNWFVDLTSFGAIVAYAYTTAATYKIARIENNRRMARIGIVGTAISLVFAVVQLVPHLGALDAMGSEAFLLLSLWCLLGFVFYWRTVQRSELTEYSGMSVSGTALFSLLLYSVILWLIKLLDSKETVEEVHATLLRGTVVTLLIVFIGLVVMLYIQNLVREKHEVVEREKIRAVEGSLAKSQFLFNMSHDIRTPMNAIIGYTNLALKETSVDAIHEYLSKIDLSSQHLLSLINDILEMSRIESGRVELQYVPVDLCSIFDSMRDLFAEQMRQKKLEFKVYASQVQHRYVWCDAKNFNRVLLNIISNAYKFTDEGGTVTVTLAEVGNPVEEYASYEMSVQDNGIGMSREFVERMFTAFERERTSTDSGIEGTGLGLAITKSIVDLMGGTIEVLTAPGNGTQIIIRIKFRMAEESDVVPVEEPQEVESEEPVDFTQKRLLVVEDNEINLEIALMILEQYGFKLESAENGQVAVDMVQAGGPGYYDAILMDVQMPVMDGYEATRAIRALEDQRLANVPILAMTANAFKEDEDASREAGMNAHIAKPIDVKVLIAELSKVL